MAFVGIIAVVSMFLCCWCSLHMIISDYYMYMYMYVCDQLHMCSSDGIVQYPVKQKVNYTHVHVSTTDNSVSVDLEVVHASLHVHVHVYLHTLSHGPVMVGAEYACLVAE